MAEPQTPNIGMISPNTGDLSGTWGSNAINPNNLVVDGYLGGSVSIAMSNANVTLSTPAGFTSAPSAGPTQSQNARIQISGALSANVSLIFTLPGYYIIENLCSNIRTFGVQLRTSGSGNAIGAIPGKKCHVFCDGTNVDYVNMPDPGQAYDLHGWTTYPPWMLLCTVRPYLIKDGSSQLVANYQNLFNVIGYTYGGAGSNFNLPDEMARVRVGLDTIGTGRLNNGVISGTTLASAGGDQNQQSHTHSASFAGQPSNYPVFGSGGVSVVVVNAAATGFGVIQQSVVGAQGLVGSPFAQGTPTGTVGVSPTGLGSGQNIQPSIVSCLPMIKT